MTAILLDTSAYSAFRRGHREVVLAVQQADRIDVTPIVLGELRAGFRRGGQVRRNEEELGVFLSSPRVVVQPLDEGTSHRYAVILNALREAGTPIPSNDLWIAAGAMQYGLELVTTDAHFLRVKQVIVRWFEAA
ncbi:MAG: type II toxin-antitoxin system VapC family toxin [Planctomycetes bacterium]|nr:type II toxin-antitoxin system VapC family toxin [Planctomycetota bacterium]